MRIIFFILILLSPATSFLQEATLGLIKKNDEDVFKGYTLLGNNEYTYLIDNCGLIVNQWQSSYKGGFGQYLLTEGKLLRAGKVEGQFEAGGASGIIELFDWEGNVIWCHRIADADQHLHHDLEPLPNGNFLCSVWEKLNKNEAKAVGRNYDHELWNEKILEIKMLSNNNIEIVWEWNAIDHLIQNQFDDLPNYGQVNMYPEKLDINYLGSSSDLSNWLHINSIDYNDELNQILISSRHLNEFYILDHSTTTSEAATEYGGRSNKGGSILFRYGNPEAYGAPQLYDQVLYGQHDVQWVDSNLENEYNFSVFNNEYIPFSNSQTLILNNPLNEDGLYGEEVFQNLMDSQIIYEYSSDHFYSKLLSGFTVLPNGNKLITEGFTGRVFELNPLDELVWEYIYPVNQNGGPGIQGSQPKFNYLFKAQKYSTELPWFSSLHIESVKPIELLPLINECYTEEASQVSNENVIQLIDMNIINSELSMENKADHEIPFSVFTSTGLRINTSFLNVGYNIIDLHNMQSGYYVFVFELDEKEIHTESIIKP